MSADREYWFPAKRYGYGWGVPDRWQGRVVFAAWLGVLLGAALWLIPARPGFFLLVTTIATAALVFICYLKGEPPKWRWGDPEA